MKKILITAGLLLYFALAIFLFSTVTAGKEEGGRGEVELTMTVPAGYATDPVYRRLIGRFEAENPGVRVKLITASGTNYYQKVMVMISGGAAPDLMWMGQSFSEFADKSLFLDLGGRIREAGIDLSLYKPEVLSWYRRGERLYSLPFGIDLSFVIYNRKLFREAGLPMPRDDWSFDEFLHAARTLTRRTPSGEPLCFGFYGSLEPGIFGASLFDPATGAVSCDTPEMLDYLKTNLRMTREWRVSPSPKERQSMTSDANGLFRRERVAMMPMYTQRMAPAFEVFEGMDYDMTLQPKGKRQSQWASSQAMCIYRGTPHPEEAWKLFLMFQEKRFQMEMAIRSLPARTDFMAEVLAGAAGRPDNFRVLGKAAEGMAPTPRIPHLQELTSVFSRFSGMVFAGLVSPEEGMRQCKKEMLRRAESFKKTDVTE